MNTTIKVKSTDPASQGPFVVINAADFDADKHEPFDQESHDALRGAADAGHLIPSASQVLAARDELQAQKGVVLEMEQDLRQRLADLAARENELAEREKANQAEAQRLADEKAALAAGGTGGKPDYSTMSKDELQAALTAKGISYPTAANKADLIALLTAA